MRALIVGAILLIAVPAQAGVSFGGWTRVGYQEKVEGFNWGIGYHLGYEAWDALLMGVAVRLAHIPDGYVAPPDATRGPEKPNGVHSNSDLSLVLRLRFPTGTVRPYVATYLGMGLWDGVDPRDAMTLSASGEAGVLLRGTDHLMVRLGIELQTHIGRVENDLSDRLSLAWAGNFVFGLDFSY